MHPLVVISYNNHRYVSVTIQQAKRFGLHTLVVDNASPYDATRDFLASVTNDPNVELLRLEGNFGHTCWQRPEVYDRLPERFFLTDPDLQWNDRLPSSFAGILDDLSTQFGATRIGFALDISDADAMLQDRDYFSGSPGKTIVECEQGFWDKPIAHPTYRMYDANIDTTFHLFDKSERSGRNIRIGGEFTAKHLPWYRETSIPTHDLIHMYSNAPSSTIAKLVLRELARKKAVWERCDVCKDVRL